jgi:hypothetical protein
MRAETAGDDGFSVLKTAVPHDRGWGPMTAESARHDSIARSLVGGAERPDEVRDETGRRHVLVRIDRAVELRLLCRFHHGVEADRTGVRS